MASVVLTFPPAAEYVRTARLVAVVVARRAGMDEGRLEDIRLAVGELCARAVNRCRAVTASGSVPPPSGRSWVVQLEIDDGPYFRVSVGDPADRAGSPEDSVAMAVATGLADEVEIVGGESIEASTVRLTWHRR